MRRRLGAPVEECAVRADKVGQMAVFEIQHAGCKALDEVAVMRNKQQRAVERLNRLLNPLAGCKVKVVGRLVEDEQIERIVHQLTQAQTAFLTAGQHIYGFSWVSPVNWNEPSRFRATCMDTFLS